MELRTPKRYRSGRRNRKVMGSWRWLRNLILLALFAGGGYWVFTNQQAARDAVERLGEAGDGVINQVQTQIPVKPTPTPDVRDDMVDANVAYQSGDFKRAIEAYADSINGAPNDLEAHYRLAFSLIITSNLGANEAQLRRAVDIADKAINAAPEAPDGWAVKAMAMVWLGDTGSAISFASQALDIDPNYTLAKAFLAEAYWRANRRDLAEETINGAVEYLSTIGSASPETIAVVFRTEGYIAERLLDRERAIAAYERAQQAAPTHSYIALELALSYFGNGQTDEAIALLRQSLDTNPRDVTLLFQLGRIYVNVGNSDEAIQVFQRCIEADSDFPSCFSWLGGLQFFSGNYPQAIQNLERSISNGSSDLDDWWQLGRSHYYLLRCDLAEPYLRDGYLRAEGNADLQGRFSGGLADCGLNANAVVPLTDAVATPTPTASP